MENAILDEIRSELSALKDRVAALEKQLDEYERLEAEAAKTGIAETPAEDFPEAGDVAAAEAEPVAEVTEAELVVAPAEDLPAEDFPEAEAVAEPAFEPEPEQVAEPEPAAEPEQAAEPAQAFEPEPLAEPEPEQQILEDPILSSPSDDTPIDLGIDLPDFGAGVTSINDIQSRKIHKRLMDSAASTPKWKTDLPGTPVRNIISGISLNDRVLMINKLFGEDPQLFQQTISDLNAMDSLSDAESYINDRFGSWKMDSEPVYRFMMAVRRKLDK